MTNLNSKEALLYLMAGGSIKLSNQDACFFGTLHGLIFRKKQITSNQANLFNKLIIKYKAQLKRKGFVAHDLLGLPWNTPILESSAEFTEPRISLVGENLHLRTPFNKNFISDITRQPFVSFLWDSSSRKYISTYSTIALKNAIDLTKKHFKKIEYCPAITALLKEVPVEKENLIWTPTLFKSNGRFYIAASNQIINNLIENITLDDSLLLLYKLSKMGVSIHSSVTNGDPLKEFAANFYCEVDINKLDKVALWLSLLQITRVFISRDVLIKEMREELKTKLRQSGIELMPIQSYQKDKGDLILIQPHSITPAEKVNIAKIVCIKNSRPIAIK